MFIVNRSPKNPIIAPAGEHTWESQGAFNGCPVQIGDDTHVLYRALGAPDPLYAPSGLSTVNIAVSKSGADFEKTGRFIVPDQPWDKAGCEDPRVTFFEGRYFIFYTALGGYPFTAGNIRVGVAISRDLKTIDEKHLVTPFNAKAMALFPERINGKVVAIFSVHTDEPPAKIAIVECNELDDLWDPKFWEHWHEKLPEHIINPLRRESDHVEVGAPPLRTKDGWLLFYSYIQNYFGGGERVFGIEAILLGENDPRLIVGRTKGPILVPEELYERHGTTENIVFPSGALLSANGRLDIYYGAADSVCASASLYLPDLLDAMRPERRAKFAVRSIHNPIIAPTDNEWEKKATFNAGAIDIDGTVHLLYRAMGDENTSVFGYATMTEDGLAVKERLPVPAYVPRADFEQKHGGSHGNSGCEDPRITKIGNTIYMGYTAYDGVHIWKSAITSISVGDFLARSWDKWKAPQLVTPDTVDDKDMCILPEKCRGSYYIFHRIGNLICADFRQSLDFGTERLTRCIDIMGPRPGMWDSKKIGVAGVPILTEKGWLFIYHGISSSTTYRLGAALLDRDDPTHVLARMVDPILEPVEPYEREGQVPRVVFSCGGVAHGDNLIIYYGGADSVIGVATFSIKKILSILLPEALG
jgi:beta-1,2-mannobiose phosphorylase / 1,2-beta-oligomannan phosphorylase